MMSSSETFSVLPPSSTGNVCFGFAASPSRNSGSTVAGSLPTMPASAARSVPWPLPVELRLPNRCTLQRGGLRELVLRQLRAALVEVVGDAHRPDRVRARRAGADLVELVERRHHRPLRLLHDVEAGRHLGGQTLRSRRIRGRFRLLLLGRHRSAGRERPRRRPRRCASGTSAGPRRREAPPRSPRDSATKPGIAYPCWLLDQVLGAQHRSLRSRPPS